MRSLRQLMTEAESILDEVRRTFPEHKKSDAFRSAYLEWNSRLQVAAGRARIGGVHSGRIELSSKIFSREENQHEFRNVVLHEIAHLLAPPRTHHGTAWKHIALRIGCTAERTHELACTRPRSCYPVTCNRCGDTVKVGAQRAAKILSGAHYTHSCGGQVLVKDGSLTQTQLSKLLSTKVAKRRRKRATPTYAAMRDLLGF